ncbi:MAG: methionine biosynthesis protein MetW [Planctomycetes bacterium]|nr:methionine biosynthesis protein MetW [Planctomycetota bacterium]
MGVRIDYEYIEAHIPQGARVLDLGCGDGALLQRLIRDKGVEARGIEINEQAVRECIRRGVPVYHGDMLEGMSMFRDGSFDCVILSQTLQQALNPAQVAREMLRVGRRSIISYPNFGHWRIRLQLLFGGRAPITKTLPYRWHDTPNLRVLTVKDFRRFCRENGMRIVNSRYFTPAYKPAPAFAANLFAATAVSVLEAREAAPK